MAKTFYFHVLGSAAPLLRDQEGVQLPNVRAALREALRARRELLRDDNAGKGWALVIADERDRTVMRVPLGAHAPLIFRHGAGSDSHG